MWVQSLGWEDPLEEDMATHSSILAWIIPRTEKPGDAGDVGSIPGLGRSPGGRHGNPLQYSCLENPAERGAWWTTLHCIAESRT